MVDGMHDEQFWPAMEAVAHTIAYDGRIMGDTMSGKPLSPEPWSSITVPTLVMAGGASPEYMRAGARELVSAMPNAQFRVLADQDHGPADDVLAPVLVEFFTS
jgi:pimeloyl-ACP methyl ester carboxylesterase